MLRSIAVLFACVVLCSCSNYPLPQDYTGSTTADIVANFRCEARAAIRRAALKELDSYGGQVIYDGALSGSELARRLRAGELPLDRFTIAKLSPEVRKKFGYYSHTQLALDFTLQGVENNTQGIKLGLTKGLAAPVDTISLGGTATRVRDVSRNFVTIDKFDDLGLVVTDRFCAQAAKSINIAYPAEGRLPLFDLVQSYIDINSLDHLSSRDAASKLQGTGSEPATPTMADTIIFTTTLASTIDPTLNYNPLAKVFTLTSLGVQNDNTRQDKHQVIATIITGPVDGRTKKPEADEKLRSASARAIEAQRGKLVQDAIISIGSALSQPGTGLSGLLR